MNQNYSNDCACNSMDKYAQQQNTIYDPLTNTILYGINSQMEVSGVSDGTCNQINPIIFTQNYMCGAGTAGANRCVGINNPNNPNNFNSLENFQSDTHNYSCDYCDLTQFIITIFLVLLLIITLYTKYSGKSID